MLQLLVVGSLAPSTGGTLCIPSSLSLLSLCAWSLHPRRFIVSLAVAPSPSVTLSRKSLPPPPIPHPPSQLLNLFAPPSRSEFSFGCRDSLDSPPKPSIIATSFPANLFQIPLFLEAHLALTILSLLQISNLSTRLTPGRTTRSHSSTIVDQPEKSVEIKSSHTATSEFSSRST